MGKFSKYRSHYLSPERLASSEIRERRLTALLEREQRFVEVPNFSRKLEALRSTEADALYRGIKKVTDVPDRRFVNDRQTSGHKAASIAAALSRFKESDFADAEKRKNYRRLRAAQEAIRQNVRPTGSDKRRYDPTGKDGASTVYGTMAHVQNVRRALNMYSWVPAFVNPAKALPCIERAVRREVMFALGHAGRGYHTAKKRNANSGVPC